MAQQMEETRYIVVEHDKITRSPKPPRLVTNLNPFRKRFAPFATEDEFKEDCLAGITKRYGIEVRVASSEDVEKHGGDAQIHSVADSYNGADERAKQEKLTASRKLVPFLDGLVKSDDDLELALTTYGLSTTQIMAMAKSVRPEGIEMSENFVKAYSSLVSARAKKAGNSRTEAQIRKDWNAMPKTAAAATK